MKCQKCGMIYDGPPDSFSGLCPLCARTANEWARAEEQEKRNAQIDREMREAYIQGHIQD